MSTDLPFDIQLQIIKRLPVKTLIQFMSVCKTWMSLIVSSRFIADYVIHQTQPQHLVIKSVEGDLKNFEPKYVSFVDDDLFPQRNFTPIVPPFFHDRVTVIGISQGLLCLFGLLRNSCPNSGTEMAVIWNVAIRKSIAIEVPYLVYPPLTCVLGFWVCPNTSEPKLVRITCINKWCQREGLESISVIPDQVMVFTLNSGEWRIPRSNLLPRKSIAFAYSQVIIGQLIYWIAYDKIEVDGEIKSHNLIMSFDMCTEEFKEVYLPDNLADPSVLELSILKLRESLIVVNCHTYSIDKISDVWMMEDGDKKTFTKMFTIKRPEATINNIVGFRIVGFSKSGKPIIEKSSKDIIETSNGTVEPWALIMYEPCSEKITDLGIYGYGYSFSVNSYTESLLLLDFDDGHIVRCGDVKS